MNFSISITSPPDEGRTPTKPLPIDACEREAARDTPFPLGWILGATSVPTIEHACAGNRLIQKAFDS